MYKWFINKCASCVKVCDKMCILIKTFIIAAWRVTKWLKIQLLQLGLLLAIKKRQEIFLTSHVQMQKRRFYYCSFEWFLRNHDWNSMSEDWNWSSSTFLVHLTKSHHEKIQYLINEPSTWITNRTKLENRGLLGLKMCLAEVDWVTWNLASPTQPFW